VTEAIKALDILEKEGLDVGILNMSTVKPLDEEAIIRVAEQPARSLPRKTVQLSAVWVMESRLYWVNTHRRRW